jgi:GT2 family glycosyltransferase
MNSKIGIGIITCNRPDYLKRLAKSLTSVIADELIIVNDGDQQNFSIESNRAFLYNVTPPKQGVAKAKNIALTALMNADCEHIFLIEDDVEILDKTVFEKYINAAKDTGILHFNFGPGTPFNRIQNVHGDVHNRHLLNQDSKPNPKLIVEYKNTKIALYEHIAGTFSYYNKRVLDDIGIIDEQFYNAWDHVEHSYRIIQKGYHPPFWWFADIADSDKYLTIQSAALDNSAIAKSEEWYKNLYEGMEKYKKKHGWVPNQTPHTSQADVLSILKNIKTVHG